MGGEKAATWTVRNQTAGFPFLCQFQNRGQNWTGAKVSAETRAPHIRKKRVWKGEGTGEKGDGVRMSFPQGRAPEKGAKSKQEEGGGEE